MPSCANARTTSQSSLNAFSSCSYVKSTRAVHCASACKAIHSFRRAKCRRGADAGFREAQSSGCVRPERDRQSRLQNRTGQGVDEVDAEQGTTSGEVVSGVEQCPHAAEVIWRS